MNSKLLAVLLKNSRDRTYAQAAEILNQELGENFVKLTYEDIRKASASGYTSLYLHRSFSIENPTLSAKIPIILKLAQLDLQKGTTIPELVDTCCRSFPIREAIHKLIELGKENESEDLVVKSVFSFKTPEGTNCLIDLFHMATKHKNATENNLCGSILRETEKSFFFLIGKARSNNLMLDKVFNHTTEEGLTLFSKASRFSERITRFLLGEKVKVNSITHLFMTADFRVRLKIYLHK